jgi:hypothetical protein
MSCAKSSHRRMNTRRHWLVARAPRISWKLEHTGISTPLHEMLRLLILLFKSPILAKSGHPWRVASAPQMPLFLSRLPARSTYSFNSILNHPWMIALPTSVSNTGGAVKLLPGHPTSGRSFSFRSRPWTSSDSMDLESNGR